MKICFASGLSTVALILFSFYLHFNIVNLALGNSGVSFLIAFLVCSILSAFLKAKRISWLIKKHDAILSVFLFFLSAKILLEAPHHFRDYLFGSTGGILFFYICGSTLVSSPIFSRYTSGHKDNILVREACSISVKNRPNVIPALMITCANFLLCLNEFNLFYGSKRTDLFLADNSILGVTELFYQRIGDFILIKLVLCLLVCASLIAPKFSTHAQNRVYHFHHLSLSVEPFIIVLTFGSLGLSFFTSLLIGSNKSSAISLFFLLIALVFFLFRRLSIVEQVFSSFTKACFSLLHLRIGSAFKLLLPPAAFSSISLLFAYLVILFNSGFYSTTVLNRFNDGKNVFSTRLDLLTNLPIHFDVAPLWGHINADGITTGEGTYIHFLPVYLLTHLGILGLVLFLTYIICLLRNAFALIKASSYSSIIPVTDEFFNPIRIVDLLLVLIFLCALIFASISSNLFWGFLWFSIGLASQRFR